jgi:hypothetical protein
MTPNPDSQPVADNSPDSLDLPPGMFRAGADPGTTIVTIAKKLGSTEQVVNMSVTYEKVPEEGGDLAMFEGDIVLGTVEEIQAAEQSGDVRGIGIIGAQFRWPSRNIPYVTVPELAERVKAATAHWQKHTPFCFIPRTNEKDFLSFEKRDGCWSRVGRQGGKQVISLGLGCGLGAAVHEIGHALGLWHEQSRSDRDQHITVLLENVAPQHRHNFDKHVLDGKDLGKYDFGSIMHYPPTAFSINKKDTIVTKHGESIGQRVGMSAGDIAAIRMLYPNLPWPKH